MTFTLDQFAERLDQRQRLAGTFALRKAYGEQTRRFEPWPRRIELLRQLIRFARSGDAGGMFRCEQPRVRLRGQRIDALLRRLRFAQQAIDDFARAFDAVHQQQQLRCFRSVR